MEEFSVAYSPMLQCFAIIGAIAFVSEEDIDHTWRLLKPLLPPNMIDFTQYYEAAWIGTYGT